MEANHGSARGLCSGTGVVLVVDDDRAVLDVITEILETSGFEVVTSLNAMCSHLITRHRPDVILMDVNMPGLKGDAVCGILTRHRELLGHAVIVLHSGRPQAELAALATQCGADGAIEKGQSMDQFVSQVTGWVAQARSRS